jgi:sterol desaturase/sphingolipid hydroxylase (fatty acid hydroxylase superfamily)
MSFLRLTSVDGLMKVMKINEVLIEKIKSSSSAIVLVKNLKHRNLFKSTLQIFILNNFFDYTKEISFKQFQHKSSMKTSLADFDFLDPTTFIITCIAMFFVVMIRYFILSGFFHSYFYLWKKEEWKLRKINTKAYPPEQFKKEITWSTLQQSFFCYWSTYGGTWQKGYTQLYTDLHWYDIVWFPCSIVISMLIHETYYYWIHRWMHHPKIYHLVHKVHHDSKITSAWTAFSFHPIEVYLKRLLCQRLFVSFLCIYMPLRFI